MGVGIMESGRRSREKKAGDQASGIYTTSHEAGIATPLGTSYDGERLKGCTILGALSRNMSVFGPLPYR